MVATLLLALPMDSWLASEAHRRHNRWDRNRCQTNPGRWLLHLTRRPRRGEVRGQRTKVGGFHIAIESFCEPPGDFAGRFVTFASVEPAAQTCLAIETKIFQAASGLAILQRFNGHLPLWRQKQIARCSLILVRPMRAQSVTALLMITSVWLWPAHAHAADSAAVGRAYTLQVNDVARRVVIAELVKHPERIHRMSMKCTIQLDGQGHPQKVQVVSNTHNRWAEDTARRALAAAKFPPLPKSLVQQSGTDKASFDYQLDLGEPR